MPNAVSSARDSGFGVFGSGLAVSAHLRFLYRAWRYRLRLEPAQIRFVLRNLRPGDVAADVGAHKGAYTHWMRRSVSPGGRVYAFEPQERLARYVRERTPAGRGLAEVFVENSALSSFRGRSSLRAPGDGDSPGVSVDPEPAGASGSPHSVECDTLDAYFERAGVDAVRLIKCDVEGHELEVFRGGERLLRRDRPFLLFECERRHRADRRVDVVFAFLRGLGYTGWFHHAGQWHSVDEFDPERFQQAGQRPYLNNFVFIHPRTAEPEACL